MDALEKAFLLAYQRISQDATALPADTMLRIYAYYKQATQGKIHASFQAMPNDLKDAFKFNAWSQISHLSKEEAMQAYIDLAHSIFEQYEKK